MPKELPRWLVTRIRGSRAEVISTIRAKDGKAAIALVVKDRKITDRETIKRLAARPA